MIIKKSAMYAPLLRRIYQEQRLVVFHRSGILNQDLNNFTGNFRFNFIEELHRFYDTDHGSCRHFIADIGKDGLVRRRSSCRMFRSLVI